MNKTEQKAVTWLKEQGYKDNEIIFNIRDTPDFNCLDGKRYEIKFLYGNQIIFHTGQIEKMKDEDEVLVFDRDNFVTNFKWKNREEIPINIKIIEANTNPKIAVEPETKRQLDSLGNKGDTYDNIITKLIEQNRTNETRTQ